MVQVNKKSLKKSKSPVAKMVGHIGSISLKNVRSFTDADIPMAGAKVIVCLGNSNEGKSNIVRSVIDVLTNRSGADSFVQHGEPMGGITIDDVALVKGKEKSKTVNRYSIVDPGTADGWSHFDSVGRDVPIEVLQVLNMEPIAFDENFIEFVNVAEQRGPQFFVDHSPAQRAKIIGSVCGLAEVYTAVRNAVNDEKLAKKAAGVAERINDLAVESLNDFDSAVDLAELQKQLIEISDRWSRLQKADLVIAGLRAKLNQYRAAESGSVRLRKIVSLKSGVDGMMARLQGVQRAYTVIQGVKNRVVGLALIRAKYEKAVVVVRHTVSTNIYIEMAGELYAANAKLQSTKAYWHSMKIVERDLNQVESAIGEGCERVKILESDLHDAIQASDDICPICETSIAGNKQALERVKNYAIR